MTERLTNTAAAAQMLLAARKTGNRLDGLPPALVPKNMGEVLAVIEAVDAQIPEPLVGWKFHAKPGAELCAAPLYGSRMFLSPARVPIAIAGSLYLEAEISFRFTRDFGARDLPYADEDVFEGVEACVTFEVVDPRYSDLPKLVKATPARLYEVYADHMANGGFVFSAYRKDWRSFDFTKTRVTMKQGDRYLADQIGGHPNGSPAGALPLFVNWRRERGGIASGHFVASGSFTSFRAVDADQDVVAEFEGFGQARARIARMT
jgi:2-keto-4-pentenoate hydratase